jgi:hypothetical protein
MPLEASSVEDYLLVEQELRVAAVVVVVVVVFPLQEEEEEREQDFGF